MAFIEHDNAVKILAKPVHKMLESVKLILFLGKDIAVGIECNIMRKFVIRHESHAMQTGKTAFLLRIEFKHFRFKTKSLKVALRIRKEVGAFRHPNGLFAAMIVVVADYSGYFRTLAKTRTVTDEVSAPLTVGQELLMRLSCIKNLLNLRFGRLT